MKGEVMENPYEYGVLAKKMFDDEQYYVIGGEELNSFIVQLKHDLATKKFDWEVQYNWEKRLEAFLDTHVWEEGEYQHHKDWKVLKDQASEE